MTHPYGIAGLTRCAHCRKVCICREHCICGSLIGIGYSVPEGTFLCHDCTDALSDAA